MKLINSKQFICKTKPLIEEIPATFDKNAPPLTDKQLKEILSKTPKK
jgi:hypothetical protein